MARRSDVAPLHAIGGGISADKPGDAEAQSTADSVKNQILSKAGLRTVPEFVVVRYTTQVTGSINYNMKIRVGKDKFIHAKVSLPMGLDQKSVSKVQTNKSESDKLT